MLRYSFFLVAVVLSLSVPQHLLSQELFVYSEPASNMPTHSLGIRATNWAMYEQEGERINYHFIPELMYGVNRNLMVHVEGFISNRETNKLVLEGGALYAKYRLLSIDELHRHFRAAVFSRLATNNSDIHQQTIQVNGHNSGYQLGFVTTQLLHKTAISLTGFYEKATNNGAGNELPVGFDRQAYNYIISAGRLFYPQNYRSYKQTNVNMMLELIGQWLPSSALHSLDIAPSIQLIINSQARVDLGYRFELYSDMYRTAPTGWLIRGEYLIFGVGNKK